MEEEKLQQGHQVNDGPIRQLDRPNDLATNHHHHLPIVEEVRRDLQHRAPNLELTSQVHHLLVRRIREAAAIVLLQEAILHQKVIHPHVRQREDQVARLHQARAHLQAADLVESFKSPIMNKAGITSIPAFSHSLQFVRATLQWSNISDISSFYFIN